MPTLHELAESYGIQSSKAFFPVNSLRLLYYLISDFYSGNNADIREHIGSLIPKVEAVLAARTQFRANSPAASLKDDWQAIHGPLRDVFEVVNTPKAHQVFEEFFSYTLPLQDESFLHLYNLIYGGQQADLHTLKLLLRVRSMDSIIFSTLIEEVLAQQRVQLDENSVLSIHYHVQLAYQLNDIVDAIVFAKDDIEEKNFSPFEVIRRIAPEPQDAKQFIHGILEEFQQSAENFVFPTELQGSVLSFYQNLMNVVHGA